MIYNVRAMHEDGDWIEFIISGEDEGDCLAVAKHKARDIFSILFANPTVTVHLTIPKEKGDPKQTKMPL